MTPAKIWRTHLSLLMQLIFLCFVCIENGSASPSRVRCEKPDMIPNGSYRLRRNNMVMRITCNVGYQLQGYRLISCVRGKWSEEKPVCAKKGCKEVLKAPENGQIHVENELKAILYCLDDYNLAGNRYTYCNGTHWDRPIGNCRAPKNVVQHSCDFETDDICGWVYEPRDGLEWKRVIAANVFTTFRTGPRHDHTTLTANGGHYMLMESLTRQNTPVILTSPIYERALSLKTSCCFQFYYFMYGAGVGSLYVILKPISISLEDIVNKRKKYKCLMLPLCIFIYSFVYSFIKFQKTGNQNNLWNEAHFSIEELEEDFQIVFAAKGGQGHLSDIAIDDVHLMTGDNCRALDRKADPVYSSVEYISTTPYESIYDTQSCVGRCNDINNSTDAMYLLNHLMGLCDCNIGCEETCCPDFKIVCLSEIFMESTTMESDDTKAGETIEPETGFIYKSTARSLISSTSKTPVNVTSTSTTLQTVQPMEFTTPSKSSAVTSTTTTTTTTRSTLKTIPTTITVTTSTTTPSNTIAFVTTTSKPTTASQKSTTATTIATTRRSTTSTQKTTITAATSRRSTTTTRATTTTSRKPTTITPRTSTTTRKTLIIKATTTTPLTLTIPLATITTTENSTNLVNNTTNKPSTKSKTMVFIVDHDDISNPDVIRRGTDLLYCTLAILLTVILCVVMYRRCGDRAVHWSMIRFSRNNSGDEETSSIIGTFNQPQSKPLSYRCKKIGKTAKRKFHFTSSSSNSHTNDIRTPLWEDDEDDDEGGDVPNTNGNLSMKNKLFTEL
uniref:Sushi domain-containing protein n=1 Tax=Glossina palpalis gambiensis TaxID=67801 RepID=A0A1B0AV23_9MUSC